MVAIITGAASGMGAAAARILAREGASLALVDIDLARLAELQAELGGSALIAAADVSRPAEVRQAVEAARERFGRIDALLHFAGILDSHQLEDVSEEVWQRVIDVNLKGTFFAVQAVAPVMQRQGAGRIVLTASDSARMGSLVSGPAYVASKGGVIGLTRTLAAYLGPSGVCVNCVCPGLTLSPMSDAFQREVMEETARRTPLRRLAQPEDVASVAAVLASDATRFVNGEVVEVNGGFFFD